MVYGAGLRSIAGSRLWAQDEGADRCETVVRDGKGAKGRVALAVNVPAGAPMGEPGCEGRRSPSRRRGAHSEGGAGGGGGCPSGPWKRCWAA